MTFDAVKFLRSLYEADETCVTSKTPPKSRTKAPDYTADERRLTDAPHGHVRATMGSIMATFTETGGAQVIGLESSRTWRRRDVARMILSPRGAEDRAVAVALRDAWRERVGICTIEGGLSIEDAKAVAWADLRATVDIWQQ